MAYGGRRDEGFYRALFEVNPAIKLLLDPCDGRIVDANHAAEAFYGYSRELMREMTITDINVLTRDEVHEEMENARIGRRRYFRFRHRTAGGEIRHVEVHSGPVELDGQQLLLSIVHDVTDRDRLEAQLTESRRLEAVGRVAGAVAHDFNNLLTVILASAGGIARTAPDGSPLMRYADDVLYAARRATALTAELLAFSRPRELRIEEVSVACAVESIHGVLARLLAPKIALALEVECARTAALLDRAQFEQVLMNLAINARDAMRKGGRLTICCDEVSVGERDGGEVPSGRWARIAVKDEGEGMTPEVRARVFEPFFTTKPVGMGTGLGLATVLGVVTQCRGHITVESEPGRGSTFTLYFPVAGEAPHADSVLPELLLRGA